MQKRVSAGSPEMSPAPAVQGAAGWLLEAFRGLRSGLADRRTSAARRQMRVVETLQLGGRRQIVLVQCAGEQFMIGAGPDSIQTIVRVRPERAASEPVSRWPVRPAQDRSGDRS